MRIFLSHHLQSDVTPFFFFFFPGEGVIWQELQAHVFHSFLGFQSNFLEIPVFPGSKGTLYLNPESISKVYSLSLFVCYTHIHIETNMEFLFVFFLGVWFVDFFPFICCFFLSCCPCWEIILQKSRISTPQVILKQQPDFPKKSKSNVFGCFFLSSCRLQNLPNIVYRIVAKGIRPICAIGSRTP